MKPCGTASAHSVLCLDSCNGYYGRLPGYDSFMYRYYFTGEVGSGECSSSVANAGACKREECKLLTMLRLFSCSNVLDFFY
jgi:hypothetical protein